MGYGQLRVRSRDGRISTLLVKSSWSNEQRDRLRWNCIDFKPIFTGMAAPDQGVFESFGLTGREKEILTLELEGFIGKEIADRLSISLSTVKGYVQALFGKLPAASRTQAVARARELGLLP